MATDYKAVVRQQEQYLKDHPEYCSNYPLKFKWTEQPVAKLGGRKKKSGNSGGVGRVARRKKRALLVCHAVKKGGK